MRLLKVLDGWRSHVGAVSATLLVSHNAALQPSPHQRVQPAEEWGGSGVGGRVLTLRAAVM